MSNAAWQSRKEQAFARGMANMLPIYVQRASNAEVWDIEGRRFLDFGSGIAVLNTGHSHPRIVAAVRDQVEAFSHTCIMVSPYTTAIELAERLNAVVPIEDARTIFVSTGAEAVENAIKIARAATGRPGVIAFSGGFHGRTNLCMGLTGKVVPYKKGFGPFTPEIYHAPFPADYLGFSAGDALAALDELFKSDIEPDRVAAMIIEPIQGEGGFYPVPDGFLGQLREICDRHGIVFVVDEIQTGFARTGRMFACQYEALEPDILTLAKGIAGGYPLAAVVGKRSVMDAPDPGGLGGTYAGSPLGCAAGLAVLDIIEQEQLCERALEIGSRIRVALQELDARHPGRIGDIRGRGAMVAMELVEEGDVGRPDAALAKALVAAAGEAGLLLLSCGVRGNVIRLLVPLTIPFEHLDEGLQILRGVFDACVAAGD
ncbi:MAG: 4-aminobutyrate--2-oxoglutarate transaminase [Xanthomonadales bacterium]|nr:4-aminobutyrate--2-oxoglutarate transaminase [Xanthomonadales bacterium]NIN60390.1 4-aminobutyrate--2-oxoglutarate transaminase [Xanthomonadales bacterium]NIN75743.1 4-aminobutyrate--2-oxoglutarate transaminase [Xanthomonadales bacterium]NIO14305.1 4-aminobutyrate--2-oxoglutarate transaminase [Xanthomonadales bacterium]NIP12783.1 4-aminobutyrate--2-oxoglutarate transaminase [Xanthomonadales bacterium]